MEIDSETEVMTDKRFDPQLLLKTLPPRGSSGLLFRERLSLQNLGIKDKGAIVVQAPAGFGKTSLLAQWRRSYQASGAVVVWLTIDERDDALRIACGIANGLCVASGKKAAGPAFLNWLGECPDGITALTGVLVEISEQTFDLVIILDNFDRSSRDALFEPLAYLIRNAPANLQIVVSTRTGMALDLPEVIDQNITARIGTAELAFQYTETLAVVEKNFGSKLDAEASGRLHELSEGWPLGLQLVIATMTKSPDLNAAAHAISAFSGDIHRYFVENLIDYLGPEMAAFLTRLAIFDPIHPDLCAAVFPGIDAHGLLLRLQQETPVFSQAEGSSWVRMHGLARDFFLARYQFLPPEERRAISADASRWLTEHGLYEEAARHALLAGEEEAAYALAERTLYQVGFRGQVSEVLEWIDRLPPSELKRRPALWTAAAWSLVVSNRQKEAESVIGYILSEPASGEAERFEAALMSTVSAGFDDRLDRCEAMMAPWLERPVPASSEIAERVYTNAMGFGAFYRFEPARARQLWAQVEHGAPTGRVDYSHGFAQFGIGLSYLWEGKCHLAEKFLRSALVLAERDMGRRNPVPCMIAAVLAATLWEMGGTSEPRAILSYRLDVLEKSALPDAVVLGYVTLARLAMHEGQASRAFEYLDALVAVGIARDLPRLQVVGLSEQIRLHAQAQRRETVISLCNKLAALCVGQEGQPEFTRSWLDFYMHRANAYRALSVRDWPLALAHLETAADLAEKMHLGREAVEIRLLRGLALERSRKVDSSGLIEESLGLAKAGGMVRTLLDVPSEVLDLVKKISDKSDFRVGDLLQAVAAVPKPAKMEKRAQAKAGEGYGNTLLTSKEREILTLIANNMSNKQIAIALDIGEETVKWHAKNLFGKLSASNRSHAVKRAYLLGILESSDT